VGQSDPGTMKRPLKGRGQPTHRAIELAAPRTSAAGGAPEEPSAGRIASALAMLCAEALAVIAPVDCAGCGANDLVLCGGCRRALGSMTQERSALVLASPEHARRHAGCRVWFSLDYDGIVKPILHELKEAGRLDLTKFLAPALAVAVVAALDCAASIVPVGETVRLVAAPSSRSSFRRRGYRPVDETLARALRRIRSPPASRTTSGALRVPRITIGLKGPVMLLISACRSAAQQRFEPLVPTGPTTQLERTTVVVRRALRLRPGVIDQAGLSRTQRWSNLHRRVSASSSLAGRYVLIVDDVVTTGATILECRRAIEAVGGVVVGAACVCRTPLN
jgi:predicted amidophosphoribosyltransferase